MFRIICFSIYFLFHPVHVSFTSIDYVPAKGCFKVFVRMYLDDFKADYKFNRENTQSIDFSANNSVSRDMMEKYIDRKLMIKVNEEELQGKMQDLVVADNEISMNLEYKARKIPESITVKSLIMTDIYRDQSNMIIVKINEFEEGIRLTSDNTEKSISFQ